MSTEIQKKPVRTLGSTLFYRTTGVLFSGYTYSTVLYGFALLQTYTHFNGYPDDPYLLRIQFGLIAVLDYSHKFYARPWASLSESFILPPIIAILATALFLLGLVMRTRMHTDETFDSFTNSPMKVIVGTFRDLTVLASILMLTLVAYFKTPPSPHFPSVEELQLRLPWVKQSFNLILIWSFVYGGAGVAVQLLYLIVKVWAKFCSCVLRRGGKTATPTPSIKALELELAKEKAKSASAEAEANASAEAKRKLENEIREAEELLKEREEEIDQKDANIRQLEKEIQKRLAESQKAVAEAQELSVQLSKTEQELSQRIAELAAAQAFLTKVDAVSEAEVVSMVENLNTLISSASGTLSDTWDQREPVSEIRVEGPGLGQIRHYFSDLMLEQIAARNSVAVTLAVEMYLVQFIKQVTSGWGTGHVAETLGEIYGRISTEEDQTIASRWRTLTKRYIPPQEPLRDEEIIDGLTRILMITKSFSDFSEATGFVGSDAGTEIKSIIEATLQLDDTIKTKIARSEMSVYIVPPGTVFTEETMVDGFREDGAGEEGGEHRIAGTMEIGLLQKIDNVEKVLRKPKVILERDLPEPEVEGEK